MNEIQYRLRSGCYVLSETNDKYVKQWTDNRTTETVINVFGYQNNPHLTYRELNDTHYQWCGPMLLIAEYFAKFSKTK